MIDIPLAQIKEKLRAQSGLSDEEITKKIKKKLDELAGLISEEGAAHIIANELGVKLHDPNEVLTINKLISGLRSVEIVGKAKQIYEVREFNNERRSGKVGSFLLADPTGVVRVTLWNDQADNIKDLKEGDVVKLKGAYVRDNQGRIELHVSENIGKFIKNPEGVTVDIDVKASPKAESKKIAELSEADQNVTVMATIVQVFEPRFFAVCPECNSRAREEDGGFVCQSHGQVQPNYNYVLNMELDDGSGNMRSVLWREQAAKLLGKSNEEMLALKDQAAGFEHYKTELLGVIVSIRGRVTQNRVNGKQELVAYDLEKDVEPSTPARVVVEKEVITAVVNEDTKKVESIEIQKESEILTSQDGEEDELFTLEDLEDLDDD